MAADLDGEAETASSTTVSDTPAFSAPGLFAWLLEATDGQLDELGFGVIGLDENLVCTNYNSLESQMAGLSKERVIGELFFEHVAPCMNNFMIADVLHGSEDVDVTIAYTLSVRVKPTPVDLRLLAAAQEPRRFLVIDWSAAQ